MNTKVRTPRSACTERDTISGVSATLRSFVNIDISLGGVLYADGPACADSPQRAHPGGVAAGSAGAVHRPRRRRDDGRADRRRCRGVAEDLLPTLHVQTRLAV